MVSCPGLAAPIILTLLVATTLSARADGREELIACQQTIERAAQAPAPGMTTARPEDRELQRCRQIVRDWSLRESRMSVDENGKPLR